MTCSLLSVGRLGALLVTGQGECGSGCFQGVGVAGVVVGAGLA